MTNTIKNVPSDAVKQRPAAKASSLSTRRLTGSVAVRPALLKVVEDDILKFDIVADDGSPMVFKHRVHGVRLGSDFSGISCESIACKAVNLKTDPVFFCEKLKTSRMIIQQSHHPKLIQEDVTTRDPQLTPKVDVFSATFPCQPFSSAGKQDGVHDIRGLLVENSLDYIRLHTPKAIIFENVDKILWSKFKPLVEYIKRELTALNYVVREWVSNVKDYHVPQNRSRWYMVALEAGSKTFNWPGKLVGGPFQPLTLRQIVKPLSESDGWRALPTKPSPKANVGKAYKIFVRRGINPFENHIVIDMGASASFTHAMLDMSPCLTRRLWLPLRFPFTRSPFQRFSFWAVDPFVFARHFLKRLPKMTAT